MNFTHNTRQTLVGAFRITTTDELDSPLLHIYLDKFPNVPTTESELRKILVPFVENTKLQGFILVDGNSVWNVSGLLIDLEKLVSDYRVENFSKELYNFFSLRCGSIAHYNRHGWFGSYPTLESLKSFFKSNEFGQPVVDSCPEWDYDARLAQKFMAKILGV